MTLEGASPATLIFAGVRSDSRCPKDARCIRAGEAVVALELRQASGPASTLTFDVPPGGGATQTAGGWRVDVVSLDPQTQTDVEIAPSDYVVTVTVRPA